jgi:hypothetical protein
VRLAATKLAKTSWRFRAFGELGLDRPYSQNIRTCLPTGDYASYRRPYFGLSVAPLSPILIGTMNGEGCGGNAVDELVASFAHRLNLLKYGEKTHVYAASLPLERTSKRCSEHAHVVLHAATSCHAFFWLHRPRLPLLASTMAKVHSIWTPENSQPAQYQAYSVGSWGGLDCRRLCASGAPRIEEDEDIWRNLRASRRDDDRSATLSGVLWSTPPSSSGYAERTRPHLRCDDPLGNLQHRVLLAQAYGRPPPTPPFGGRFFSSRSETGSTHCYHDGITTTHVYRRKPCLATGDY